MEVQDTQINNLVHDINTVLREEYRVSEVGLSYLLSHLEETLKARLTEEKQIKSELRMSSFGSPCDRRIWYSVNAVADAEPLPPHTRLKFLYGDIIEELILALAKEAGHSVEGRQDTLELYGIKGHRDAVIDGITIDVKSANSRSFQKFSKSLQEQKADVFFNTYLEQLQLYMAAAKDDPLVTHKNVGGFLAFNQELGHVQLKLISRENRNWERDITNKINMVSSSTPPPRAFEDEKDGESGNKKLKIYCSYCPYKKKCWPGLRTFLSSSGPKHLTVVKREPNMIEVK